MTDLVILQACAPDYRKKFYAELSKRYPKKYLLLAGSSLSEESVKTDYSIPQINKITNHYILNRRALVQFDSFWTSLKAPYLVIELTPRTITNWALLLLRKLMGKKTALWGHAWPRSGKEAKTDKLRSIMRSLGDKIILYTQTQVNELRTIMPDADITYAANAIYYKHEMHPLDAVAPLGNNIIYVGRLHKDKKPCLAIQAFAVAYPNLSPDSKLVFVGSGDTEMQLMKETAQALNISDKVIFKGHISEHETLKQLYHDSFVSVSPGYVGLSITQSFGFGVPIIIGRDEPHAPEVECAIEGENCAFFESNNVTDFANKLIDFYKTKNYWSEKKASLAHYAREKYSVEKMVEPFLEL
jgi:glycosyltransferase involved in cell wall biosynthesis